MNPQKRFKIFEALSKATPHPTTELIYQTPFQLLIAVILSAQATDKSVNKATLLLFSKRPNNAQRKNLFWYGNSFVSTYHSTFRRLSRRDCICGIVFKYLRASY